MLYDKDPSHAKGVRKLCFPFGTEVCPHELVFQAEKKF